MIKHMHKALLAAVCTFVAVVPAAAETIEPLFLQDMSQVKAVREFPAAGFRLVETDEGTFLMSENGRFIVKGPVYDMWLKEPINSVADIDNKANRMDMSKFNLDFDDVVSLSYGNGSSEVVMFVSSTDKVSLRQLSLINDQLREQYTFRVILLPENRPESMAELKVLGCNQNTAAEQLDALLNGNAKSLKPSTNKCPTDKFQRTLLSAKFIGVDHVPFTIAPDGRFGKGLIKDLATFLNKSGRS